MRLQGSWNWPRLALLAALCLAACSPPPTPAPPVEVTRIVEVTAPPRTIRVGYASEADFGDVPSLMALDLLANQGYGVLPINFATSTLAIAALADGTTDIGAGSFSAHWAASSQGAPIVTVAEQVANLWQIHAINAIRECADLDGRPFAISSDSAVNAKMTNVYIAERCPGTTPQVLLIQGSQNRAAALLAGEIDATPVELSDAIQLDFDAPGRFHTLTNFGQDLPNLATTGLHVNRDFAARNPESVTAYLKALLTVHREISADHELLATEAARRLNIDPEALPLIVDAYFAINAWDVNGGLTEADVQYTLKFFQDSGDIDASLSVDDVADLSYLNQVLDDIGRQE